MTEQQILISVPVIFKKDENNKVLWFVVRQNEENGWELPKVVVRKVESSVRASIRSLSEQGGMRAQVYEEVGRRAGSGRVNGNSVAHKYIYYLIRHKGGANEVLEFVESDWLEYSKALKKLENKRDQAMLTEANVMFKALDKEGRFDRTEEEDMEAAALDEE